MHVYFPISTCVWVKFLLDSRMHVGMLNQARKRCARIQSIIPSQRHERMAKETGKKVSSSAVLHGPVINERTKTLSRNGGESPR